MRHLIIPALIAGTALPLIGAAQPAFAAEAADASSASAIDAAVAADLRGTDKARDQYRHPKETLEFFQVKPNMVVAEYAADAGWYSKILAPLTATSGKYVALGVSPSSPSLNEERKAQMNAFPANYPARAAKATGVSADKIHAFVTNAVPAEMQGKVDRVLIFRMLHNLQRSGILGSELDAIHGMLAPGGMVGIEQHRAKADAPAAYVDGSKGYLKEADVIAMFEKHGFVLAGKSEINANPKDPANHAQGVWTLPPNYALKDVDKDKYAAIGESDRMTLLFKKK
ncbi:MAG: class I SAM-dependent methyltransferase [Blastomonas fulva]|jgi:predicted methyltransferase|uniref:class I SAM-dependent methyltransferase n=1 Tax=Blastomonas TaxID=150203 RepID=UPI0024E1FA6B|nr:MULTISPECIES: methyltransferase [Blastomonas]MCO5793117.1 class I SAM-dependent methyltransferase [Blastomonas sp.]MDK2755590.1 methyltransferase [Blastomonas fulva]